MQQSTIMLAQLSLEMKAHKGGDVLKYLEKCPYVGMAPLPSAAMIGPDTIGVVMRQEPIRWKNSGKMRLSEQLGKSSIMGNETLAPVTAAMR